MFKIICALALNHTIGTKNKLPWHLKSDLQHFKKSTLNKRIIMGRKTYESIGKPLPHRTNVVISRSLQHIDGTTCNPKDDTLKDWQISDEISYIAGGSEIYKLFLPYCHRMSLTWVQDKIDGDTLFPIINMYDWHLESFSHHLRDTSNDYNHTICEYVRKSDTKVFTSLSTMV